MKVLILTPYILFEGKKEFIKNRTGFAIMLYDIANSLAMSGLDVGVLTQSSITEGEKIGNIEVIQRTWFNILTSVKFNNIRLGLKTMFKNGLSLRNMSRIVFYSLSGGYVEKIIKRWQPDIVHIHSINISVLPFIYACIVREVPFLVTTHGLIPDINDANITRYERKIEREFYKLAIKKNIPVTTVSTGMKERIEDKFNSGESSNIQVITNGICINNNCQNNKVVVDLRKLYNIPQKNEIMLCVGSVGVRKNQMQVVRACALLEKKEDISVLILGNDTTGGKLQKEIDRLNLSHMVKNCGFVERKYIREYYEQADYNILASIDEGFGLSIIEAFSYGIPTITYKDLDAIKDLYDEKCMVIVNNRNDRDLSNGIRKMIEISWDRDYILGYSRMYSLEKMSQKYISFYKSAIRTQVNMNDFKKLIK